MSTITITTPLPSVRRGDHEVIASQHAREHALHRSGRVFGGELVQDTLLRETLRGAYSASLPLLAVPDAE